MASLKGKKTLNNLLNKGFLKSNKDHKFLEFWHNGRYVLQTFCSHNGQDIDDYLIAKMKKQCHLDKQQFLDLANCPLSQEEYVRILIKNGTLQEAELGVISKTS